MIIQLGPRMLVASNKKSCEVMLLPLTDKQCISYTGLVAAVMLGPRTGKYDGELKLESCSLTNVMLGTFMLWWGWLGFNCGSTFGITGGYTKFIIYI